MSKNRKVDAAKRFKAYREGNFLTQKDLAGMLGVARETVCLIERGRPPRLSVLRKFLVLEKRPADVRVAG